ncbi:MAG: acetylornithine/succinylornithine family transaminase [Ruminococcaceae bacterium]|nr:acetylornithine/succinylornithine family transaminase [Oscillospiraceae bacterium]
MSDIKALDKEYIANTYARFPLELVKGKGSLVQDEEGKEYIDLGSGIAVTAFGIADEKWAEAVSTQASTLQHTSNLYYTSPAVKLAQMLSEKTGMKKVFFSNSGAEANECAIKTARKYAAEKKGAEYFNIITLKNSFHGRTVTTLAATGQDVFHKDFLPLTEGFLYADVNDCENIVKMATENKVAAIMIECVQGEGGVAALNEDFVKTIADICEKEDIILICDEVQCGNGRCGELYCYMNYGISPDIVSTAKGLGGGLPLGATLFGEKTKDVLGASDHGSTFGGNPVCCAGALSIISRIDDRLLYDVRRKSEYIFNELSGANGVKSVSGMGLMIGIETEKNAADVINECMANGVLVLKAKTKVRLLPALNIPDDLLIKAISVLKKACEVNV